MKKDSGDRAKTIGAVAALITAIAALITAFGLPKILPELFQVLFNEGEDQSVDNSNSVLSDSAEESKLISTDKNEPEPVLEPEVREPSVSAVEAVRALRQEMSYLKARETLFSANWRPVDRRGVPKREDEGPIESPSLSRFGVELSEIDSCQGTGMGLCSGILEQDDGRSVSLIVAQCANGPCLVGWNTNFYIEPSQKTLDSVNQLKQGLPYTKIRKNLIADGWRQNVVNPMHMHGIFPSIESDFKIQFPTLQSCKAKDGVPEECIFSFFTTGEKMLEIIVSVEKLTYPDEGFRPDGGMAEYKLTVKEWAVR